MNLTRSKSRRLAALALVLIALAVGAGLAGAAPPIPDWNVSPIGPGYAGAFESPVMPPPDGARWMYWRRAE